MGTRSWPRRSPGEPPPSSWRDRRLALPPSVTRRSSAWPIRWRRSARWRPAGGGGSIRWSSGSRGASPRPRPRRRSPEVLAGRFRTLRNEGNENNEIGLPLTLLRLGPEHEVAVLEMGMYVGGEIAELARDGPAAGSGSSRRSSRSTSRGSDRSRRSRRPRASWSRRCRRAARPSSTPTTRASGGWAAGRVARAVTLRLRERCRRRRRGASTSLGLDGMRFRLRADGDASTVAIPALGRHSVHNALAAAAVGRAAGLALDAIAAGLARRLVARHTGSSSSALGSVTLLDDTLQRVARARCVAALDLLAGLPGRRVRRPRRDARARRRPATRATGRSGRLPRDVPTGSSSSAPARPGIAEGAVAAGHGPGPHHPCARCRRRPRSCSAPRLRDGDVVLVKASRGSASTALVDGAAAANSARAPRR